MTFDLEKHLQRGIPLDEAAAFFHRLRGQTKEASLPSLEAAFNELTPDEQLEVFKVAADSGFIEKLQPGTEDYYGARMLAVISQLPGQIYYPEIKEAQAPPLPATAMGQNMQPALPTPLPATGQGQNTVATKSAEAKTPKERAHEQIEIAHEKYRHSGGERLGKHVGTLLGAATGAAAGRKSGHSLAGAAVGALAGRALGRDVGEDRDVKSFSKKMKHAAAQMKIAFGDGMTDGTTSDVPGIRQYLASEEMGQSAQEENAAEYYQRKFQEATQQLQQTQEQAEMAQTMADTLQQQVAGSQEQIQAAMQQAQMASQAAMSNVQQAHEMAMGATSQAMESQAEVLRQKQLAAAMKMGITQVKDQVMSALASDPTDQLAQQLTSPPPGSGGMVGGAPGAMDPNAQPGMQNPSTAAAGAPGDPNAQGAQGQPGTPGQEAGAGTAPNSAGTGEEGESASDGKSEKSKSDDKKDPQATTKVEIKHGSALPFQFPMRSAALR